MVKIDPDDYLASIKFDANDTEFMDGWKKLHQIYFGDKSIFKEFEISEKNK